MNSAISTLLFVILVVPCVVAQKQDSKWQRVITGPGFNIDLSTSSLMLEPNRIFSAKFKTSLSKSERVDAKPGVKYTTRLETIQFDSKNSSYRIAETTLLDSSGKIVSTYAVAGTEGWKPIRRGTASQLYDAARALPPFGTWKVVTYRYADGSPPSSNDPPELTRLIGSSFWLSFDIVQLDGKSCSSPMFEARTISNEEFVSRIGSPLKSLGDKIESVFMKCESDNSSMSRTFFIRLANTKMLLLWEGVLLELENPHGWGASLLKLISN